MYCNKCGNPSNNKPIKIKLPLVCSKGNKLTDMPLEILLCTPCLDKIVTNHTSIALALKWAAQVLRKLKLPPNKYDSYYLEGFIDDIFGPCNDKPQVIIDCLIKHWQEAMKEDEAYKKKYEEDRKRPIKQGPLALYCPECNGFEFVNSSNGLCPYCSSETIELDLEHGKDGKLHVNLDKMPKTKLTIKW